MIGSVCHRPPIWHRPAHHGHSRPDQWL